MATHNSSLGAWGETRATRLYEQLGYEILDRNWRPRSSGVKGELDLVCLRNSTLVVVEVKTRSNARNGFPVEAITEFKRKQLRILSALYLQSMETADRQLVKSIRIDVASVMGREILILENAC